MSTTESLHYTGPRGGGWVLTVLLCIFSGPLAIILQDAVLMGTDSLLPALVGLTIFSIILSIAGFISGPISALWCLYLGAYLILFGLSDDRKYFISCSSKDFFEAELVAMAPVFMFPAAVAASYMLFNRAVLRRKSKAQEVVGIIVICTASAQLVLWYFHKLELAWPASGGSNVAC